MITDLYLSSQERINQKIMRNCLKQLDQFIHLTCRETRIKKSIKFLEKFWYLENVLLYSEYTKESFGTGAQDLIHIYIKGLTLKAEGYDTHKIKIMLGYKYQERFFIARNHDNYSHITILFLEKKDFSLPEDTKRFLQSEVIQKFNNMIA